jgi:Fe-S cluster assembly scaffold protein SufB
VLLIDDTVVNKTIPLILCAEEDVQGAHGASLGRPDEELLFYMQSRGLDRQEALRVLEKAKLDRVIGLMPHAAMREYASCLITEKENEYE